MRAAARSQMDTPGVPFPVGMSGGIGSFVVTPASVPAPKTDFPTPVFAATTGQPSSALRGGALIHRVEPVYSRLAQDEGIAGTVKLRIIVGRNGAVRKVKAISGPALLRQAAADAVRQWRYEPSLFKGKPVEMDREVGVEFQLPQSSR